MLDIDDMFFGYGFQLVVGIAHAPQLLTLNVTRQFLVWPVYMEL